MNFPSIFSTWSFWVGWRRRWWCRAGVSRVPHSRGASRDNHRCGMGWDGLCRAGSKARVTKRSLVPCWHLDACRSWSRGQGVSKSSAEGWAMVRRGVTGGSSCLGEIPLSSSRPADGSACRQGRRAALTTLTQLYSSPWKTCGPASNPAVGSGAVRGVLC